jgi:nucleotide-binding universal stress UspA family protein
MAPLKVLIPLDGSAFSNGVVSHIVRLLRPEAHHLVLLRVADEPIGVIGKPPRPFMVNTLTMPEYATALDLELAHHPIYASQQRATDNAALRCGLQATARELEDQGYTVEMEVRFGDPAEEIISFARDEHVDLIAIGTHGRTGLRRVALGSVTAEVLRTTTVPVLVVRLVEPLVVDEELAELFD